MDLIRGLTARLGVAHGWGSLRNLAVSHFDGLTGTRARARELTQGTWEGSLFCYGAWLIFHTGGYSEMKTVSHLASVGVESSAKVSE